MRVYSTDTYGCGCLLRSGGCTAMRLAGRTHDNIPSVYLAGVCVATQPRGLVPARWWRTVDCCTSGVFLHARVCARAGVPPLCRVVCVCVTVCKPKTDIQQACCYERGVCGYARDGMVGNRGQVYSRMIWSISLEAHMSSGTLLVSSSSVARVSWSSVACMVVDAMSAIASRLVCNRSTVSAVLWPVFLIADREGSCALMVCIDLAVWSWCCVFVAEAAVAARDVLFISMTRMAWSMWSICLLMAAIVAAIRRGDCAGCGHCSFLM